MCVCAATSWSHHPASSCTDNTVGDSGMGGAAVGREKGTGEFECVCVCVWEQGGWWLGVSSLTFLSPPNPSSGLHLRKWILQSVYSAPRDKTNTWDVKASIVSKPNICFTIYVSLKREKKKSACIPNFTLGCNISDPINSTEEDKTWPAGICSYLTASPGTSTGVHLERNKAR